MDIDRILLIARFQRASSPINHSNSAPRCRNFLGKLPLVNPPTDHPSAQEPGGKARRSYCPSERGPFCRFDILAIAFTIVSASSSVGFLWFWVSFPFE